MEISQWGNLNHLFCRKVSFLTAPHCQFRGVGQGIKDTYLYLWYPLFQAQWIDAINEITKPKTDGHDITEILLKVALQTITLTLTVSHFA